MVFRLAAGALLCLGASAEHLQGVFTTSNAADMNQVSSYAINDDGSLSFVGVFDTGGKGYPFQVVGGTNFTGWTGANCVSYHVNGNDQWLLASNMGGVEREPSLSIFKIAPDLTLTLTDNVDVIPGTWAESVTGYQDRACVLGSGETAKVQCFRIDGEGKLSEEWMYDLNLTLVLDVAERGHSDCPSVQFSPDGTKLGVLSNGSVDQHYPFSRIPTQNVPEVIDQGGFYSFPVLDDGYGDPMVLEIDPYRRPFDFVWSPTSDRVWTVGIPNGITSLQGNVETIDVSDSGLTEVGFFPYGNVPTAPCWVEYLNGILYASNFVVNHDLAILETDETGAVNVETPEFLFFGLGTAPVDVAISGARTSGDQYLFVQLAGAAEIASYIINDDGSLTEVGRYPIVPDDTWVTNAGVATTTLSVAELEALENATSSAPPSSAPPSSTPSVCNPSDEYFEDVSDLLGSFTTSSVFVEDSNRGAAWFDFNNDGNLDLFIPNLGQVGLFKNNGDGTFEEVSEAAGIVVDKVRSQLVGDIDNDGYQDLVIVPLEGNLTVYKNNGDGTFTDVSESAGAPGNGVSHGGAMGDFDGDGFLDIFMTGTGPAVLDLEAPRDFVPNKLYKNNGDFTFTDVTDEAGVDGFYEGPIFDMEHAQACIVTFHDYNGDRRPDIIVGNCQNEPVPAFYFYKNNGDGTFTDVAEEVGWTEPGIWMGISVGDIDGDGDIDFYTGSTGTFPFLPVPSNPDGIYPHALWRNNGDGTYTAELNGGVPNHEFNWGSTLFDFDNDGDLDIANLGWGANPGRLFINDGTGNFDGSSCVSSVSLAGSVGSGVAHGDFDNDGYLDLILITAGEYDPATCQCVFGPDLPAPVDHPLLLRNKGSGKSWLTIKLVGTTSNRDGLGAVVKVGSLIRESRSGSGFSSVDQVWPHFGLGSEAGPVDVTVQWPSGMDETFTGIAVNQIVTLTEGETSGPAPTTPGSTPTAAPETSGPAPTTPGSTPTAAPETSGASPMSVLWSMCLSLSMTVAAFSAFI